jgi:membrane protease YdiL (CAAX protease family)
MALPGAVLALLPVAGLALALPAIAWFFKDTWHELDLHARSDAEALQAAGRSDPRPLVAFVTAAVVLTVQHFYGGHAFYVEALRPLLAASDGAHPSLRLSDFDELYSYAWWVAMRVVGFVLVPFAVSRALSSHVGVVGFGLSGAGFFRNAWIGALFLAVMLPLVWVASRDPGFARVYPNYRSAGRSGVDLVLWELLYLGQFLALEMFLRGWLFRMLRSFGSGAIFAITLPYVMMHFEGKPYVETMGAIVAGVALGSLAAKTKSIWLGFLLHGATALSMDLLALAYRGQFPARLALPT